MLGLLVLLWLTIAIELVLLFVLVGGAVLVVQEYSRQLRSRRG